MLPHAFHKWLTTMWTWFSNFLNFESRRKHGTFCPLSLAYTWLVPNKLSLYLGGVLECLVARLQLPHAIAVRFHVPLAYDVILTPEMAGSVNS